MNRRRRVTRLISRMVATLAIGALVGYLVPMVQRDLAPKQEVQTVVPESPVGRQFINAFTSDDQAVLTSMGVTADIKLRASRFKAEFTRVDVPVHLGSYVGGGFSLHSYASHVVRNDGTEDVLSWRVATAGGQAGLILPPNTIEDP